MLSTPLISDPGFPFGWNRRDPAWYPNRTYTWSLCCYCRFECFLGSRQISLRSLVFYLQSKKPVVIDCSCYCMKNRTMIFYEAPHRLLSSLQTMAHVFGESRHTVVARELTKIHEVIVSDSLQKLIHYFEKHSNQLRGRCVILNCRE